jgi:CBS-domain-containing membrane protein
MDKNTIYLNENDTLEHAVDMFVKYNLTTLPVIDAEGDMVGVVSAQELFKICLPDYILWIDDLSPIINFEPFADMLRMEHSVWLHDIMAREYVVLQERAPAIQVVKEITKHEVNEVFILRGKKLVGIIRSQDFLTKVLRQ